MPAVHEGMQPDAGEKRQQDQQVAKGDVQPVFVDKKQGTKPGKSDKRDAPPRP
jgi:hypothetical protein